MQKPRPAASMHAAKQTRHGQGGQVFASYAESTDIHPNTAGARKQKIMWTNGIDDAPRRRSSPPACGSVWTRFGHDRDLDPYVERQILMEAPGIEPPERGLETRVSAAFPHVTVEPNVQTSTPNCAEVRAVDDSRTNRQGGRARMMANLSSDLHEALEAGDLEAARVANEAMTRLLGGTTQPSAPVVDLGSVRARRTGTT